MKIFQIDDNHVGLLAAANLGIGAVSKWLSILTPVVGVLVSLGQVAVAVVTVIYITKKTKKLSQKDED